MRLCVSPSAHQFGKFHGASACFFHQQGCDDAVLADEIVLADVELSDGFGGITLLADGFENVNASGVVVFTDDIAPCSLR